jgi:hypothetical protein
MANSFVAGHADRLPWLKDEVRRPKSSPNWAVAFVAASAVAILAAVSFWLGMNDTFSGSQPLDQAHSEARVDLSPASEAGTALFSQDQPPMPEVEAATMPPAVALPAQQDVRLEAPPVRRVAARSASAVAHRSTPRKSASRKKNAVKGAQEAKYANPWKSRGVSGRMVRVGAYSSLEKSKEAWSTLAQLSPAIKQLPAVVTDIPSPTGRTLYWLQIGTTSQAHSEVLCQRMRAIKQRCVVVDVAGARKGSENERQPAGI